MKGQLKEKIEEEISKLSTIKQEAISSVDWVNIVEEIGKKNYLTEKEIATLVLETTLVFLGVADFDLYVFRIEEKTMVDNKNAQKITNEVLEKVFTPISQKIESSIKNRMQTSTPTWQQTISFIVSGGDYSVFLE